MELGDAINTMQDVTHLAATRLPHLGIYQLPPLPRQEGGLTKRGKSMTPSRHNYIFPLYLVYTMIPQVEEMGWVVVLRGSTALDGFRTKKQAKLTELHVQNRYPF